MRLAIAVGTPGLISLMLPPLPRRVRDSGARFDCCFELFFGKIGNPQRGLALMLGETSIGSGLRAR
jgi:hypothetical protein